MPVPTLTGTLPATPPTPGTDETAPFTPALARTKAWKRTSSYSLIAWVARVGSRTGMSLN